jgi:hypothetical protein
MESKALKKMVLKIAWWLVAAVVFGGCAASGIYSKVPPAYDLSADSNQKVLIWVEAPRSAAADPDAADKLAEAIRGHLILRAKLNPDNVILADSTQTGSGTLLATPEMSALQEGAAVVLFVRIEEYELLPMSLANYHSGRMLTRAVLLDAKTSRPLWPAGTQGKVHDIVIELGQGDRMAILSRLTTGSAHCILRNLYPIMKMHYKHSDERVSFQEAFEQDTF